MRVPLSVLIELCEHRCAAFTQGLGPATDRSLARIREELRVEIPPDLVAVSRECASYSGWFAGLGEEFDHPLHILQRNRAFHDPEESDGYATLPERYVLFNHGHDGDCDCWDTEVVGPGGEHPIVYANVDADVVRPEPMHGSFRDHLTALCGTVRAGSVMRQHRERVREILAEYPELRQRPRS